MKTRKQPYEGEMIDAALSYIYAAINTRNNTMRKPPKEWPLEKESWQPHPDAISNLQKAVEILATEIERRINTQGKTPN